jgi:transposase
VLDAGLDLSRRRVDVCLISAQGELLGQFRVRADRDGLSGLARRVAVYGQPVRGVVESMNGARFVHDELVAHGWEVLIADAQRVEGLAPWGCKTDKLDARVLAELSLRELVPAIWLPTPGLRREREISRWRAAPRQAPLDAGEPGAFDADRARLRGADGRPVRARRRPAAGGLEIPQPWRGQVDASLELIDDLELRIARIEAELKGSGADHRYLPLVAVVIYAPGQMGASPSGAWSGGLRSCVGPGAGPGPCPRSTQGAMLWLR